METKSETTHEARRTEGSYLAILRRNSNCCIRVGHSFIRFAPSWLKAFIKHINPFSSRIDAAGSRSP